MFEQIINVDRMEQAVSLFGSFDENIKEVEDYIIAGSRGWFVDKAIQPSKSVTADHEKIINREVIRLRMSLDAAKQIQKELQLCTCSLML